ncbi:MAG: ferredoxin [Myxococcota bacterium]
MAPRVRFDAARCVGHGRCYVLAPEVFGEDEAGHCVVLEPAPSGALVDAARLGASNCPEDALAVEDGEGSDPA